MSLERGFVNQGKVIFYYWVAFKLLFVGSMEVIQLAISVFRADNLFVINLNASVKITDSLCPLT